jgi:uncharacterized phage protein gp47/JayE
MAASFAELQAGATADDVLEKLVQYMLVANFNVTSWQAGSLPRTLLEAEAEYLADESQSIAQIAKGGFPQLAKTLTNEDFLDQVGIGFFDLARGQAVFTRGMVTLTAGAGVGPETISAGQIWVTDSSREHRYSNLAAGTLPLNGTLTLEVQAESSGSGYNLGNNTLTELITPLPGVSVNNPARTGSLPWVTQQGADRESNDAYAARMMARWATLGTGSNEAAYVYYATSATAEVTRAIVTEDSSTGSVIITVSGSSGPVSSDALSAVSSLLQTKRPLGISLSVQNASASNTLIGGTVFVSPSYDIDATVAAVETAVTEYAKTVPIGGPVYKAQLIEIIMTPPGVYNVTLSSPAGDIDLLDAQVFVPSFSLVGSR